MKEKHTLILLILLLFVYEEQLNINGTDTNLNPLILWGK